MKIVFMGTPDFAVPALQALIAAEHEVVAAYTQPPRPGGRRGKELTPTPVHKTAEALGIEVRHPVSLKSAEEQAAFAALEADAAIVAAYGLILPQAVLDAPRLGCLNIHASLLPRWRGAAPIQRAILAGDEQTGVTIMQMEAGLDTGPMLAAETTPIGFKNAGTLTSELAGIGAQLMIRVLGSRDTFPPKPQPEIGVTYANKIDKAETHIDFKRGARDVERQIRAFSPAPGAWFEANGERIKILEAVVLSKAPNDFRIDFEAKPGLVIGDQLAIGCGIGAIRPTWLEPRKVQRAGRGVMDTLELLRGFPIPDGTVLK